MSARLIKGDVRPVTTDDRLLDDLKLSLRVQGCCPVYPTFGEWIAAVRAHGVTDSDPIDAIEYNCNTGKIRVERDVQGGPVKIGEQS